jgi:hypothetical protein
MRPRGEWENFRRENWDFGKAGGGLGRLRTAGQVVWHFTQTLGSARVCLVNINGHRVSFWTTIEANGSLGFMKE